LGISLQLDRLQPERARESWEGGQTKRRNQNALQERPTKKRNWRWGRKGGDKGGRIEQVLTIGRFRVKKGKKNQTHGTMLDALKSVREVEKVGNGNTDRRKGAAKNL